MTKKTTLEDVAKLIVKQGKEINDLTDTVGHIVSTMATKDDLEKLDRKVDMIQVQVNSIEQQLRTTKADIRLGNLEQKVFGSARG